MPRLLPNGPRPHPAPSGLSRAAHARGPEYPVLAAVSGGCPGVRGRLVTCYSPVRHCMSAPKGGLTVRLACVRHAASVHPEPGSNSPFKAPHGCGATDRVSLDSVKTLRGARGPDGVKVKLFASNVRLTPEMNLGLPSSVSGCEGAAGPLPAAVSRERRKEVLYAYPFQLSRTFFEFFRLPFLRPAR